ncbi:MAG TPA: outer membrane beta-barrel protein [Terracidiphilus sp.]|nr:outer membrane beta-barrel protein [Terracidiphilus sp.]
MLAIVFVAVLLSVAHGAYCQVAPSARDRGLSVAVGDNVSGFYLQYGARKMGGLSAFVDLDTTRHWGLEAEGRWLVFHRTLNVQDATYLVGPRYYFNLGKKFQPYAKGLVGPGLFTFDYNASHGTYLVVATGGGVDYYITSRLHLRIVDIEYQNWPHFPTGAMSAVGVSTGFRYTLF